MTATAVGTDSVQLALHNHAVLRGVTPRTPTVAASIAQCEAWLDTMAPGWKPRPALRIPPMRRVTKAAR